MAAILSHAVAGAGIAAALRPQPKPPASYWMLAIVCSVIPDLDVILVWLGTDYRGMFGHRGITHSILFAAAVAALLAFLSPAWPERTRRFRVWLSFFAAGLSHGVLDALMSEGKGVAFFAPFSSKRFHFPIRPIESSSPGRSIFLREGGVKVSGSEILWIWAPFLLLAAASIWIGRRSVSQTRPLSSRHE